MNTSLREGMLGSLLEGSRYAALEDLPALVSRCAAEAGLQHAVIYLVDLQQATLHLLTGVGLDAGQEPGDEVARLPIKDSAAGEAYQYLKAVPDAPSRPAGGERRRWWAPLLDGTERIGVLGADLDPTSERAVEDMHLLAQLVTLFVVSKRGQSDSYSRLVRTQPMNVAAEMQWHLMPPLTFTNHGVEISGVMEPAYQIAGDTFDYAVADGIVYLALFDAMGHDLAAGLTANLASAACRNHRRQKTALADLGAAIEKSLLDYYDDVRYLTAVLVELDLNTGVLSWTNHGHHPPVVIRDNTWFVTLNCPPSHPLGADLGLPVMVCREQLQPSDRVLLYTDGIIEARHPHDGSEFGLDRLVDFLIRHNTDGLPIAEVLRRLIHSVLDYHHGHLADDATVLLMETRDSEHFTAGH